MDLPFLLMRREIFGSRVPATPGLRWFRLMSILPKDCTDEIFLGFTADGRFLVSYTYRQCHFRLRLWLIPGDEYSILDWLKRPFAELLLEKQPAYAFLTDAWGIRFLQSVSDPQTFVLLFSSVSQIF